ncbi:hypothetical protein PISMIDRAFT_25281 [Pisolithus microcarpus 441]|uniref:Uncharacterized protein n=1 Tax=Pisolithus microcarpus 441 TaxID=765257 RepID=A0A0C9YFE9_9AGAM|nr:hypothetical protein PISMIDRAFT_25281 [Pisolithus microcarpus 441]
MAKKCGRGIYQTENTCKWNKVFIWIIAKVKGVHVLLSKGGHDARSLDTTQVMGECKGVDSVGDFILNMAIGVLNPLTQLIDQCTTCVKHGRGSSWDVKAGFIMNIDFETVVIEGQIWKVNRQVRGVIIWLVIEIVVGVKDGFFRNEMPLVGIKIADVVRGICQLQLVVIVICGRDNVPDMSGQ